MPLAGLLYFHRISDNRISGTLRKNLDIFRKMCGKKSLGRVVLVTTMWDTVETGDGENREEELKREFLSKMTEYGARIRRFTLKKESAFEILREIVTLPVDRRPVRLQKQLVDIQLSLAQTDAGRVLYGKLDAYVQKRAVLLETLREKYDTDKEAHSELEREYQALEQEMQNEGSTTTEQLEKFRRELEDLETEVTVNRERISVLRVGFLGRVKARVATTFRGMARDQ